MNILSFSIIRSQLSAVFATLADFLVLMLLVEAARLWYVAATVCGAITGAAISFILGRQWVFPETDGRIFGQGLRYAAVSGASVGLNTLGVYGLTEWLGLDYLLSKGITAGLLGLLFNYPLHRKYVFR